MIYFYPKNQEELDHVLSVTASVLNVPLLRLPWSASYFEVLRMYSEWVLYWDGQDWADNSMSPHPESILVSFEDFEPTLKLMLL